MEIENEIRRGVRFHVRRERDTGDIAITRRQGNHGWTLRPITNADALLLAKALTDMAHDGASDIEFQGDDVDVPR